jgi:ABC transporter substrate binding protein
VIEWRSAAGKYDQLGALVTDLVRLKVDVIVADVTRAVLAAKQATTTIPIVFTIAADPMGNGLVSGLARPGGNVTGCSILLPDISAKRLQLLTEAVPAVSRVAVLWNPSTPYHKSLLKEVEAAAPSLRLQHVPIAAQDPGEFEGAFAAMAKAHVNALFIADDPVFAISRTLLLRLAAWAVVKERGYEGLVAKDAESLYRGRPTRSWIKCKIRHEGHFVLGGILGLPHTFAGILVGQRVGRRSLFRGTVEWGLGMRTAKQLLERGRQRTTSPFHDFRLSRGVTWLEPTLTVELTYSELMEGRLRDPVYRGLA